MSLSKKIKKRKPKKFRMHEQVRLIRTYFDIIIVLTTLRKCKLRTSLEQSRDLLKPLVQ